MRRCNTSQHGLVRVSGTWLRANIESRGSVRPARAGPGTPRVEEEMFQWTQHMDTHGIYSTNIFNISTLFNQHQQSSTNINQPTTNPDQFLAHVFGTLLEYVRVRCSGFGGLYTEIDRPIMNRDTSACSGIGITNSENKELLALPTLSTAQA